MTASALARSCRRVRVLVPGLVLILGACGAGGSEDVVVTEQGSGSPAPSTAATAPPSTVGESAASGFPKDVPMVSDAECDRPAVDDARPHLGPDGTPTDGVQVRAVKVVDDGTDAVLVSFTVSERPVIEAGSGERWVVVELQGVRGGPTGEAAVLSPHAVELPARICDDSAYAFAVALDRPVTSLDLAEAVPGELGLRIGLGAG